MKYAILLILLAGILPLSMWLRNNPRATSYALMLMGFLPFVQYAFHQFIAVISWTDWSGYLTGIPTSWTVWPGYTHGIEISTLDVVAVAIYLSTPSGRRRLPFRFSMALYFIAASLSTLQAEVPMAALFYLWQLARMFLVYAAITRACIDPRGPPALLKGMAAGLFMEAAVQIWQRFGLHILQAHGTFSHQNLLGMISHFVVFPFFAILLIAARGWLPAAVTLAGILVEILTTSRATVGIAALGYTIIFVISMFRQFTYRKVQLFLIGILTFMVFVPFAIQSFDTRFSIEASQYVEDIDTRFIFERVAKSILYDHPFGVGVNHYVLAANNGGYNRALGVSSTTNELDAHVHNVYLLVAAESGYLGLITFLLLLFRPLTVAFLCGLRNRRDQRGDLLIGLGVGLLVVYIHSLFEWVFVTFEVQYMFAITVGLVASLAQQLDYWQRPTEKVPGLRSRSS